jgi:lipopolysaccharide biosynthesis glycosyltransferase
VNLRKVAVGLDDNYVSPLLVMLFSAWQTKENDFEVIVGYDDLHLSPESIILIEEVARNLGIGIEFIEIKLNSKIQNASHITPSAYIRILLADILQESFLWLDCDLICEPGWDELLHFEIPTKSTVICAAIDPIVQRMTKSTNEAVKRSNGKYFNSGVAIIDPVAWRQLGFNDRWLDVVLNSAHLKLEYADQCVLNYLLVNNFYEINPEYNRIEMSARYLKCINVKIRHFAGPIKPWNFKSKIILASFGPFLYKSVLRYAKTQEQLIHQLNQETEVRQKLNHLLYSKRQEDSFFNKVKALRISRITLKQIFEDYF